VEIEVMSNCFRTGNGRESERQELVVEENN
jgi:hypothetical protein